MKGLELAEKFYYEYGENMLNDNFSHIKNHIAVGLVGSGSECFGFDDEISRDHDFEPGFVFSYQMNLLFLQKINLNLNEHIQIYPRSLMVLKEII